MKRSALDECLIDALADLSHQQWSGWWLYAFSKGTVNDQGELIFPAWAVARWTRQMKTPYADLSEDEKKSDRVEAEKIITLLRRLRNVSCGAEESDL